MTARRPLNGAVAGGIAAAVWAAQQPLDKRVFRCGYDDVELLGKAVTRGPAWPAVGTALHVQNGLAFGASYAALRPLLPGPPVVWGLGLALAEHLASWGLVGLVDRYHPARGDITPLGRNRRAFAQAAWRHALFGVVMGLVEARLNDRSGDEPPTPIPVESNGHGTIEQVAATSS